MRPGRRTTGMVVLYAYALSTAARAPLEIIDAMAQIQVKRIYEEPNRSDGFRVLVDRLWPRGISKERAALDLWMKTVAPSTELREWFGHDPKRWKEFVKRYRAELREHTLELAELRSHARKRPLTLLFGARDSDHNEAVVLKAALERRHR